MNQMEIVTVTDLSAIPRVIEWNHEELKTELRTQLEVYKNLVVTPDAIKSAKSDRANLNKLATAIEEYRKDVKRRCLEPYNELETKCKELVSIIKEPIEAIDTQIKAFEEQEKDEKYKALKDFFESKVGDMADTIVFEKILDPKWGNKSKGLDELKGSLEDHIDRVKEELKKLEEQFGDVPYKVAVINKYLESYNYSAALVEATTLKFRYEQEQKKKQAAEEALKAARQKREEQAQVQPEPVSEQAQPVQQTVPVTNEPVGKISFAAIGTRKQLGSLVEYMKKNGIRYSRI